MSDYTFELVCRDREPLPAGHFRNERRCTAIGNSFQQDARMFVPGEALETAINTGGAAGSDSKVRPCPEPGACVCDHAE